MIGRYLMSGHSFSHKDKANQSWFILTDSNGCRSADDSACQPLAIKRLVRNDADIKVFPNPFSGQISITGLTPQTTVNLFDIYGRTIYTATASTTTATINTTDLPHGNYILQLTPPYGQPILRKLVKAD